MNGKGKVVCGDTKCAWFKSQCKPKEFFAEKLSHWLKGGMWVLVILYYATNSVETLAW